MSCHAGDLPRPVIPTSCGTLPPISGVQRGLLLRARQRPRHLAPALLPEDESHLLRRAQSLGMVGAERRTWRVAVQRTQEVLLEEAVLATDLRDLLARHLRSPSPVRHRTSGSKADWGSRAQRLNPQIARFLSTSRKEAQMPPVSP